MHMLKKFQDSVAQKQSHCRPTRIGQKQTFFRAFLKICRYIHRTLLSYYYVKHYLILDVPASLAI